MDQSSPKIPPPAPNLPIDAGALPPSPAHRVKLLTILIILPVILVSLPAVLVTCVFPKKLKNFDTSDLQRNLDHVAQGRLPTPNALVEQPVILTVPPKVVALRVEWIKRLAEGYGGRVNEFLGSENEKHFFVELPPGRGEAYRQSLFNGVTDPTVRMPPGTPAPGIKDQVEVFIRVERSEPANQHE